ncbi:MAG: autotransporter-associated beta strand repeat-containing protein, partial [Candidatus Puniceispirillaceae bacterium]
MKSVETPPSPSSTTPFHPASMPIRPIFIGQINLIGVATLYRREVQRFMAVALQTLAAPVITSVLFLLVFSVAIGNRGNLAGGVDFVVFLVPGLIMMNVLQNAFANTSSSTFSGNVELSGGNTAHKISISSSATGYDKEQVIVGTITGDNPGKTLVKDGAGILTLHGDSSSSMDGGIQVENGTLVIGDGSDAGADPGSGTITINKGKLEIAASETIDNAIETAD